MLGAGLPWYERTRLMFGHLVFHAWSCFFFILFIPQASLRLMAYSKEIQHTRLRLGGAGDPPSQALPLTLRYGLANPI